MDPLDLTVYLALAYRLSGIGARVRHLGIASEWIRECRKHARSGRLPLISMSAFEKSHYALLRALPVAWDKIIGPEALALLDEGKKLELEGATNPAFYAARLTKAVQRLLERRRRR